MFKPNLSCTIYKAAGFDRHARPVLSAGVETPCAIVHLRMYEEKSTVRTSQGASSGAADERKTEAKILLPNGTKVGVSDIIAILGINIRVISIEFRMTIQGTIDHMEVQGDVWNDTL